MVYALKPFKGRVREAKRQKTEMHQSIIYADNAVIFVDVAA